MNLFSAGSKQNLRSVYGYVIAGGLSSLIILFLIQKSLPLNRKYALQYHQAFLKAKQEIYALERDLLTMQSHSLKLNIIFDSRIKAINSAITQLKSIPDFIDSSEQNFKNELEAQEKALKSQFSTIYSLQESRSISVRSCRKISSLISEIERTPQTLGENISSNNELFIIVNDLLEDSFRYCQNTTDELKADIQQHLAKINTLLNSERYRDGKFIFTEFLSHSKELIAQSNLVEYYNKQIKVTNIIDGLQSIEADYLQLYYKQLQEINNYRFFGFVSLLSIVVFVAYKVNSNLATTNRNIVEILENFTKELETKVEERTAQLEDSIKNTEAALAQAQNANQAKSRFLANMSHELRTPLNAILGFSQLMTRDSSINAEQQENLKIINRSGEHLLKLINDILEMSKIEVGQITLNETQFDLHLMLISIEEMLRLKANTKGIELSFQIAQNVPRVIYTDEGKLRQIIINLLGNALKFTERGTVTLAVKTSNTPSAKDKIDFLFSDTRTLNFSVTDTGPGIEPEEMKGLFTPFEQTRIGRISNEGTGLGLSICHKFVDLMGGELKVESSLGKGSNFYFDILIRVKDFQTLAAVDRPKAENRKIVSLALDRQYRILAVDDVPASRLLLRKLLTEVGFSVEEAEDGREAIAKWQQWHPDLILMDMRMPKIDGYEATAKIKAEPKGRDTIIIALTASAFEEEKVVILSAGCDDFMRKPFKEEELLEKIGQYLNIEYIYEDTPTASRAEPIVEITPDSLAVMPHKWRSQLYDAAAKVDNQEIFELLAEIPEEYESLAKALADLAEQFRCDKIINLAKSAD